MDTLFTSFPLIAKYIFQFLDNESLYICLKVSKSWKKFLEEEKFFWKRMTNGHPGWTELLNTMNSQIISTLGQSFFAIDEDSEILIGTRFISIENSPQFIVIEYGYHPIICAIDLDDVELFKTLINLYPQFQELKIYLKSWGLASPFHFAAYKGKVSFFLNSIEGEKNPQDEFGGTPLQIAADLGYLDIVKLLLESIKGEKNPQNEFGCTPLHFASRNGNLDIVKLLLDSIESEKNPQNRNGDTPLHVASEYGHLDIVKLLLDNISGEKNPQNQCGTTPLHIASEFGHLDIVKLLLDNIEGEKNPQNQFGMTPLHFAAITGQLKIVELLLDIIDGETNPKDRDGDTPLEYASRLGHWEIVELLRDNIERIERENTQCWDSMF